MRVPEPSTTSVSLWRIAQVTVVVLLMITLFLALWQVSTAVLLFVGASIVAAILTGLAGLLRRFLPAGRNVSLFLAGGIIVALVVAFWFLLGSRILSEVLSLAGQLPQLVNQFGNGLGINSLWSRAAEFGRKGWMGDLMVYVPDVVSAATLLTLVLFSGVFLAANPGLYREGAVKLLPATERPRVRRALNHSARALQQWLLGKLVSMVAVGVATSAGLMLPGVPNAFGLGFVAGVFEFVPFVGPLLGFVPAAFVALSQDVTTFWWVLGLFVVVQQLESNLLFPLVQKHAVELPPVLGMFAIVALGMLFGPLGVLVGIPVTVVTMVAIKELYVSDALHEETSIPGERRK